ncbi:hypothetical protein Sjap_019959 [Stephania japonica]|uniref:Uncharacterized protein n=1 Tax=Stephania japonica TaxID=461633 RepID=A0AAP0I013_9MAGN
MQTDSSPSYVNGTTNNDDRRNLSPISSQDSSSVLYHPNSSLPTSSLISLMSSTPSDCAATENRGLYMARLALEYQQLVDRHGLCLAHLEEAVKEAEILREENSNLRIVNKDLTKRLSLLTTHHQTPLSSPAAAAASFPSLSIINDFRSLCVGGGDSGGGRRSQSRSTSPIAAASHGFDDQRRRSGGERDSLPKSISIRSSGYLK